MELSRTEVGKKVFVLVWEGRLMEGVIESISDALLYVKVAGMTLSFGYGDVAETIEEAEDIVYRIKQNVADSLEMIRELKHKRNQGE